MEPKGGRRPADVIADAVRGKNAGTGFRDGWGTAATQPEALAGTL